MKKIVILPALLLFLLGCQESKPIRPEGMTLTKGVVSAASPEATDAGVKILNMGGNAIDAAIAVQFALAVTEPAMSGLGGGTQVLFALPGQKPISINGASISPVLTPIDAKKEDLTYHRRSTIPSTVKVMGYIFEKYGSGNISWDEIILPAIEYAKNGFAVGVFRHKVFRQYQSVLKRSPYNIQSFLMPDGNIPAPGDTIKQPVLATTLEQIASKGADEFYQGEIAREIAADMAENEGWITLEDLTNFPDPIELTPVNTQYRGYEIYSQPPPCGGWTVLLMLNILEQSSPQDLQSNTQSRFERVLTAAHLAHKNRKEFPVRDEADLMSRLEESYATILLNEFDSDASSDNNEKETGGETTHYSVVDANGMAVAVTSSINAYFGARAATSSLGFLYNSYMDDFELGQPNHQFAIGPRKMNYSSMSPTIVQKDGKSKLVIGSPGSARIISGVAQLIQLWVDTDSGIEEIVNLSRLHSINWKIYFEDLQTPTEWSTFFRDKQFEVAFPSYFLMDEHLNAYFGGIHAISFESGQWIGASDPRRDGKVDYSDN